MKHVLRIVSVLMTTSFWLVSAHYFGVKSAFYAGAAWMLTMAVKDLTYLRVRLDRAGGRHILLTTAGAELALAALRLVLLLALAAAIAPYNAHVAAVMPLLLPCVVLWARESSLYLMRKFGTVAMTGHVTLARSLVGTLVLFILAETGHDSTVAVTGGILAREFVSWIGSAIAGLLGWLGVRVGGEGFDDDEAEDVAEHSVGGVALASPGWYVIADNFMLSQWRWLQFTSRSFAGGVFGPLGSAATRLAFTYRKPGAYVHGASRLTFRRLFTAFVGGGLFLGALFYIAHRHGALPALGMAAAGFVARLAGLSLNVLFWRALGARIGRKRPSRTA